jgi:hypothetical protein
VQMSRHYDVVGGGEWQELSESSTRKLQFRVTLPLIDMADRGVANRVCSHTA